MDKSISILGCGWLGFPLAIQLIANGWRVKGSTTSAEKVKLLSLNEIDPYLVQLQDIALANAQFFNSDVLFINVPPSLKKQNTPQQYLAQMEQLAERVKASPVKNVIFISSTSVYPDLRKELINTDEVDESSVLYQSELLFTRCPDFKTTVIRFGGLIGPGRHPSRFFAGKKDIPNGKAPVNLIDIHDCIDIIHSVLDQQKFGEIYHAAAPTHPTRSVFYGVAAQVARVAIPEFIDELNDWKVINPVKLEDDLGYFFLYPNLLDYLEEEAP